MGPHQDTPSDTTCSKARPGRDRLRVQWSPLSRRAERLETQRVESFSDAVFAIAVTLLGLELYIPPVEGRSLAISLAEGWPSYLAFITSFFSIVVIWINHHRLFVLIVRVDNRLLLVNGLLLMLVTVVPFATMVLAQQMAHEGMRTATIMYCGVFTAVSACFDLLWRHAAHNHRLIRQQIDAELLERIEIQYGPGPLLYLLSMALTLVNPWASVTANLLFVGYFALPLLNLRRAPRRHRPAHTTLTDTRRIQ